MDSQAGGWPIPVSGLIGKLKEATMYGIPEYLVHVAEIEGGGLERVISKHSLVAHIHSVDKHEDGQESPGNALLITNIQQFHF